MNEYKYLNVNLENKIAHIEINRPDKANALNLDLWEEFHHAFQWVGQTAEARVAILSGAGKHFTAGIDLENFNNLGKDQMNCEGRRREQLRQTILKLQEAFTAMEKCRKPVIAAIHGGCIGGGIDMVSACDMRFCSTNAFFCIKEIDLGITADVGTLQRLPRLIGDGIMRELAYTGRNVDAVEAKEIGLVNRHFENKKVLMEEVFAMAQQIASKSPLAIRGVKEMILYTRDHPVSDSLNYVATWNAATLFSQDLTEIVVAQKENRQPIFQD